MISQYIQDALSVGSKAQLRTKESLIAKYGSHRFVGIWTPYYINRAMERLLGAIVTISHVASDNNHLYIHIVEDNEVWCWPEYMFEISSTTELGNKFDN